MKELAPICLFTYKRIEETKKTVAALQKNYLASKSELFIFSDGPKHPGHSVEIEELRKYLHSIDGFESVTIYESDYNKGLANSIINGVSRVLENYEKVIVVEDDLISSSNFLNFINEALDFYRDNEKIFSVSGYSMDLKGLDNYPKDFYLGYRSSSWGWGTWSHQWNNIDWEVAEYREFKWNFWKQLKFMRGGSDLPYMLRRQMLNKIDSWAIRWCYHQYKNDLLCVFPSVSKIKSIGFTKDATHTKFGKRFLTELDKGEQQNFKFDEELVIDENLVKHFRKKFSILNRVRNRLKI